MYVLIRRCDSTGTSSMGDIYFASADEQAIRKVWSGKCGLHGFELKADHHPRAKDSLYKHQIKEELPMLEFVYGIS